MKAWRRSFFEKIDKLLKYMREVRKASRSPGRVQAQTEEACKFVSYRRE